MAKQGAAGSSAIKADSSAKAAGTPPSKAGAKTEQGSTRVASLRVLQRLR